MAPDAERSPGGTPGTVRDLHRDDRVTAMVATTSDTRGDLARYWAGRRRPAQRWALGLDGADLFDLLAEATGSRLAARRILRDALAASELDPVGMWS